MKEFIDILKMFLLVNLSGGPTPAFFNKPSPLFRVRLFAFPVNLEALSCSYFPKKKKGEDAGDVSICGECEIIP
jgi:hypothetical protein